MASYLETLNAHRKAVVDSLAGADPLVGAQFAASCAAELMPIYELYVQTADADAATLQRALEAIWSGDAGDAGKLFAACDSVTPDDEEHGGTIVGSTATNAGLATMVALKAVIDGDASAAAPASDYAVHVLDFVLVPDDDSPEVPPAVAFELERQLAALDAVAKGERPLVVGQIADIVRSAPET
jgi:hypothetical protein